MPQPNGAVAKLGATSGFPANGALAVRHLDDICAISEALNASREEREAIAKVMAKADAQVAPLEEEAEKLRSELRPIVSARQRRAANRKLRAQAVADRDAGLSCETKIAELDAEERRLALQESRAIESCAGVNEALEEIASLAAQKYAPVREQHRNYARRRARARRLAALHLEREAFDLFDRFCSAYTLAFCASAWADEAAYGEGHPSVRLLARPTALLLGRTVANDATAAPRFSNGFKHFNCSTEDLMRARSELMERVAAIGFGPED